ncbi:MAG: hypothetical protein KC416_16290, partial [Myxococcales bacterium]|nr:hypothetical protein [Myxococcales bacterium]
IAPSLNASNVVFRDLMTGKFPAVIRLTWGIVDVRDVALAHIRAMETPAASGRYLCVAGTRTVADVTALLRRAGYDKGLPKFSLASPLGDALTKGLSYLQPRDVGTYLRTHVGRDWGVDNGKITRELGMEFRAMDETILDAVKDMERWGHLPAKA